MVDPERLVLELLPVDALPARPVSVSEVAALAHEPRDDAVEARPLERAFDAVLGDARVADAERPEVLRRPRHVVPVQAELDAPGALAVDVDLEEDLVRDGDVPGLGEVGLEQELPRVVRVLLLEDERQEIVILVPVTTVEIDAAGNGPRARARRGPR